MYDMLSRCIAYNESFEGYFDVTAITGRPSCTAANLELKNGAVMRNFDDVRINLSGFLKGYALDKVTEIFTCAGICNALISFGNSSVCALGNHPGGDGWKVETLTGKTYCLKNSCLTTSGNGDENRKHIINPLTGTLIEGKGMVSVVTTNAEEGEVQSTVKFIRNNT
jgi:thiamine biosynthesis lipoprotein